MRQGALILATLAIALLLGSGEPALAQSTVMRIEPAWKVASPYESSFSVEVWVDDVVTTDPCPLVGGGPCGLGGYQFDITFDPTVISFQSFQNGPFLTSTGRTLFMCPLQTVRHDPLNGVLSYSCATSGATPLGPEGSGHLATVTFAPVTIGDSNLHLENTRLAEASPYGTAIPHTTQDGSVTVDYQANLSVEKTAPATVTAPGNIQYNLQVTNQGPDEAENVTLVDTLSSHVEFVSATPSPGCAYDDVEHKVTCDLGNIGATLSESASITVSVAASKAGRTIVNAADASSATVDPQPSNNHAEASTTVDLANVDIVKTAPEQVAKGATDQYEIVVTSTGPSAAGGVLVTDVLHSDVVYVSSSTTQGYCIDYEYAGDHIVWCAVGDMAVSSSATITITVTFPDFDWYLCNKAEAEWTQIPPGVKESEWACTEVGQPDGDGDGCWDVTEEALGLNPLDEWDFYDVPVPAKEDAVGDGYGDDLPPIGANGTKNRVVDIGDVLAVLFYTFADDEGIPNANGVDYDADKGVDTDGDTAADIPPDSVDDGVSYDRSPGPDPDPVTGIDPAGPPNAVIDIGDVLAALAQAFLVDCSQPP